MENIFLEDFIYLEMGHPGGFGSNRCGNVVKNIAEHSLKNFTLTRYLSLNISTDRFTAHEYISITQYGNNILTKYLSNSRVAVFLT